jgi:hypothetical protein
VHPASDPSPLEEAIGQEALERYEAAMTRLRPDDREAIIARIELGLPYPEVAAPSASRAFRRRTWPSAVPLCGSRRRCPVAPLADDPLLSVAASISDGDPVDWDRMQSTTRSTPMSSISCVCSIASPSSMRRAAAGDR